MQQNHQFTLLVRLHTRSITPALSRNTLLLQRCYKSSHSRVSSSAHPRYTSTANHIPPWASLREVPRPAAMWLAPEGSKFNQQQVLDQLPKLKTSDEDLLVVLFLVTPKLAHLFDRNHSFHSRAINTIYGAFTEKGLRQSIVAVVDALPILGEETPKYWKGMEIDGSEGIAICISPGFDVTPAKKGDDSHPLISMTAKRPYFDGRQYVSMTCSAPVANTTFVNGQQNTLFMRNWRNQGGQEWIPETKQHNLSSVEVPLYLDQRQQSVPLNMYSKVIKLTDPKVILHSMGNIVRLVGTADGKDLAASHELEKIVPEMLKKLQKINPTGDIKVFALVYPSQLGRPNLFVDRIWSGQHEEKAMQDSDYNARLLRLLVEGARLYRVTSGGAGWGKKAGLLALEPMTELGASTDAPGAPSFIFEEDEEIRMPGSADLFPPGHIIQFVATFHNINGSKKHVTSTDEVKQRSKASKAKILDWTDAENDQQFCIGNTVLPETHQYTSLEDIDANSTSRDSTDNAATSTLLLCPNQFGLLTSSALGLSVRYHSPSRSVLDQMRRGRKTFDASELDTDFKHNSLIELPNSYFATRFLAGGSISSEIARQYSGSEELKTTKKSTSRIRGRRELSRDGSILVASQRLRLIESIQKESYLARKKIPTQQHEPETPLRIVRSQPPLVRRFVSEPKGLEETDLSQTQQVSNDGLVRAVPIDTFDIIKVKSGPEISEEDEVTTPDRHGKITAIKSLKIKLVPTSNDRTKVIGNVSEDPDVVMRWLPSTPAYEKEENQPDKDFLGQLDHEVDEPESAPIRKHKTGKPIVDIIRYASGHKPDIRNLGLQSGIFRVYTTDKAGGVTWDDQQKDAREQEAVDELIKDL